MNYSDLLVTAGFTIAFFLVLFIFTRLKKRFLKEQGGLDMGLVILALLPFVVYLLVSGKVKELTVGDLKVVLADEAKATAVADITPQQRVGELVDERAATFSKGGIADLHGSILPRFREMRYTTMSIDRRPSAYYAAEAIREYLTEASRFDFFKYVVFSENEEYRGWMKAGNMLALLEGRGQRVADWINNGSWEALAQEGMSTHAIAADKSALDALDQLNAGNFDDIAVVDAKNRFVSVLTREGIISQVVARTVLAQK
jgi:hypothetical protein